MSVIVRSCYLKLHPGNQVAEIIYRNDSGSPPLTSKRQALEVLDAMRGLNVSEEEFMAIEGQIKSSPLPDERVMMDDDVDSPNTEIIERLGNIEDLVHEILEYMREDGGGENWKHEE